MTIPEAFQTPSRLLPDTFEKPFRHQSDTLQTPNRHPIYVLQKWKNNVNSYSDQLKLGSVCKFGVEFDNLKVSQYVFTSTIFLKMQFICFKCARFSILKDFLVFKGVKYKKHSQKVQKRVPSRPNFLLSRLAIS